MIYGRQQTDGGSTERNSLNNIDDGRVNKRCEKMDEKRKFIDLNKFNGKAGATGEDRGRSEMRRKEREHHVTLPCSVVCFLFSGVLF